MIQLVSSYGTNRKSKISSSHDILSAVPSEYTATERHPARIVEECYLNRPENYDKILSHLFVCTLHWNSSNWNFYICMLWSIKAVLKGWMYTLICSQKGLIIASIVSVKLNLRIYSLQNVNSTYITHITTSRNLLYNGYLVSFPGVKRPGRGVDHPPPSSIKVKERVELYVYSPSRPSWPVVGLNSLLYITT